MSYKMLYTFFYFFNKSPEHMRWQYKVCPLHAQHTTKEKGQRMLSPLINALPLTKSDKVSSINHMAPRHLSKQSLSLDLMLLYTSARGQTEREKRSFTSARHQSVQEHNHVLKVRHWLVCFSSYGLLTIHYLNELSLFQINTYFITFLTHKRYRTVG